jgi:hypothetical protein
MVGVNDKPLIVMPCHSSHPAVTSYYSLDFKGKTTPLVSLKASTDVSIYAANASKIFYITHFIVSLFDTYRHAFIGFKFAKYMNEKSFLIQSSFDVKWQMEHKSFFRVNQVEKLSKKSKKKILQQNTI